MKLKHNKIFNFSMVAAACVVFLLGNRLGIIILDSSDKGPMGILNSIAYLIPSFAFSNEGFKISFEAIPFLIGIVFLFIAFLTCMWGVTWRKNYRVKEEHGSARYGTQEEADELKNDVFQDNIIFSKDIWLNLDTRMTFLNDNVLVIGGSGSGKTRFYIKPNLLQMHTNYVVTDPKGSVIREIGNALESNGYDLKVFNLVNMNNSMRYNPFAYIYKANDVFKFVNNLISNTSDENKTGGDDFWVKSEIALLTAIIFLVMGTADDEDKNMRSVMELIDLAEASEEDENMKSVLDIIFDDLNEELQPLLNSEDRIVVRACKNTYEYLACRQYSLFKKGAGKTVKSILISVGVRMSIFNLPELDELLTYDELDLTTIGRPKVKEGMEGLDDNDPNKYVKTALFVIISDSDRTFSFMASILFQQLFDMLYMIADSKESQRLPIHTRFLLDECANIGKIPDLEIKVATMRSRGISADFMLQNLAQLKNLYKDSWETIVGNCDTTLFLGGKEYSTLEYLSKFIGNATVDYLSVSETRGQQSSYSKSNQLISRQLLAPDEIGRLKRNKCIMHIRGFNIFEDTKYDLMKHPNIDLTTDSKDFQKRVTNRYNFAKIIKKKRERGELQSTYIQQANILGSEEIDNDMLDISISDMEMLDH